MNIHTIKLDKDEALKKLKAYKSKLSALKHKNISAAIEKEYESAIKGYREMARGRPLVDITEVFLRCPFDVEGYPKLAIGRADKKRVTFSARGDLWCFSCDSQHSWNKPSSTNIFIEPPSGALEKSSRYAQIPLVPANVRPEHALKNYHILWEVEKWHNNRPPPDRDPYLLKHIFGSLYAVIAEWDLTDLEMAIMKGIRD